MNNKLFRILLDVLTFGVLEIILFWTKRVKSNRLLVLTQELESLGEQETALVAAINDGEIYGYDVQKLKVELYVVRNGQQRVEKEISYLTSK